MTPQMFYVTLASKTFEIVDCSVLPNGMAVMDSDSSIECYSSATHRRLLAASVGTTLIYVIGVPLWFYRVLRSATFEVEMLVATRQLLRHDEYAWTSLADRPTLATISQALRSRLGIERRIAELDAAAAQVSGRRESVVQRTRSSIYNAAHRGWAADEVLDHQDGAVGPRTTLNPMALRSIASQQQQHHFFRRGRQLAGRRASVGLSSVEHSPGPEIAVDAFAIYLALAEARLRRLRRIAGTMRDRFRSGAWYWVLVIMFRRALVAAVTVLQSNRPTVQLGLLAAILLLASVLNRRMRPYRTLVGGAVDNSDEQGFIMSKNRAKSLASGAQPKRASSPQTSEEPLASPPYLRRRTVFKLARQEYVRFFRQSLSDPNIMEDTTLHCAVGVVVCAIMFKAVNDAEAAGWPLLPGVHFAFDAACATFIILATTHVTALVAAPIGSHFRRAGRRVRDHSSQLQAPSPKGSSYEMPATLLRPDLLVHLKQQGASRIGMAEESGAGSVHHGALAPG